MARTTRPAIPLIIALALLALGIGLAIVLPALRSGAHQPRPGDVPGVHAGILQFTPEELEHIATLTPLGKPAWSETNRVASDPAAAYLGKFLYFDTRLSSNGQVSCATCHDPAKGFSDGRTLSVGLGRGTRNSPSLFNVAHNRWFFWDGRADSLWMQALGPTENPAEMDSTRTDIARLMHDDPDLRRAYEDIFGPMPDLSDTSRFPPRAMPTPDDEDNPKGRRWRAMTEADRHTINEVFVNVAKCIASYEHRLVTGPSPFDDFARAILAGHRPRDTRFPLDAQRGLRLFIGKAGCINCHAGPAFTDGEFHNNRVAPLEGAIPTDPGRYEGIRLLRESEFNTTGPFSDAPDSTRARLTAQTVQVPENWGRFKTPSLRNVALSAPYMHQGQFATLEEVVRHYATFENALPPSHHALPDPLLQPLDLSEQEIADLVAFLQSLTSPALPRDLVTQPFGPVYRP